MSDLVGNPEDRFSQNEAQMKVGFERFFLYMGACALSKICQRLSLPDVNLFFNQPFD